MTFFPVICLEKRNRTAITSSSLCSVKSSYIFYSSCNILCLNGRKSEQEIFLSKQTELLRKTQHESPDKWYCISLLAAAALACFKCHTPYCAAPPMGGQVLLFSTIKKRQPQMRKIRYVAELWQQITLA